MKKLLTLLLALLLGLQAIAALAEDGEDIPADPDAVLEPIYLARMYR